MASIDQLLICAARATAAAADSPADWTAALVGSIITRMVASELFCRFGNDLALRLDLSAVANRVPWVPIAWRALALVVGEPASSTALAEIDARLVAQSTWS